MTSSHAHRARLGGTGNEPRLAPAFVGALSFAVLLPGVLLVRALHLSPTGDLLAMAALVAATAWWVRPAASLIVVGVAFLDINGFLLNSDAQLTWHGWSDVLRLAALLAVTGAVVAVRNTQLRRAHVRSSLEGLLHG